VSLKENKYNAIVFEGFEFESASGFGRR